MKTFKLSKVQEHSYYAIRVFGVVHLFMAIGIAVLIDGPSDGISWLAGGIIVLLLSAITWLSCQIYRAAVRKTIYGYYVLSKNAMAIKSPGKPVQFLRRRDCAGFIPYRWELIFRSKKVLRLKTPGMGAYFVRELAETVARTWWPKFAQGPTWDLVVGVQRMGPLETQVNFQGGEDRECPVLVHRLRRQTFVALVLHLVIALSVGSLYGATLYHGVQTLMRASAQAYNWRVALVALVSLTSLLFILTVGAVWGYVIWRFLRERVYGRRFLLSQRGMKILSPGRGWTTLRRNELLDYAPLTGRLRTTGGSVVSFALPLAMGTPFTRMACTMLQYWEIELSALADKYLQTDSSSGWTENALLLGTFLMMNPQPLEVTELGSSYGTMVAFEFSFGVLAIIACVAMAIFWAHSKNRIPLHCSPAKKGLADENSVSHPTHTTA
ncbi:MAG: hypothetical protein L3K26_04715 [Candidatus Hydrogenedentes bacterium]|nr:hypothetical protein [Candidatus Hydrogenedentota bacterium]